MHYRIVSYHVNSPLSSWRWRHCSAIYRLIVQLQRPKNRRAANRGVASVENTIRIHDPSNISLTHYAINCFWTSSEASQFVQGLTPSPDNSVMSKYHVIVRAARFTCLCLCYCTVRWTAIFPQSLTCDHNQINSAFVEFSCRSGIHLSIHLSIKYCFWTPRGWAISCGVPSPDPQIRWKGECPSTPFFSSTSSLTSRSHYFLLWKLSLALPLSTSDLQLIIAVARLTENRCLSSQYNLTLYFDHMKLKKYHHFTSCRWLTITALHKRLLQRLEIKRYCIAANDLHSNSIPTDIVATSDKGDGL